MRYFLIYCSIILLGLLIKDTAFAQSSISNPIISNGYLKGGSGSFTVTTYSFLGNNLQTPAMTVGDTVTFLYPANDTTVDASDELTFVWKNPTTLYEYVLEFSNDTTFANVDYFFDINANETEVMVDLGTISDLPVIVYYRLGTKGPNGTMYTNFRKFNAIDASDKPVIGISDSYVLCENDTLELIPAVFGGQPTFRFRWLTFDFQSIPTSVFLNNPNDTFAMLMPVETDSFALIVIDSQDKADTAFFTVIVEPIPEVILNVSKDSLQTILSSTSYTWFVNDTVVQVSNISSFTPIKVGLYKVSVKTPGGCLAISDDYYFVPRPKNLIPVKGSTVTQTNVLLRWDIVDGAENYRYTISKDSNFTNFEAEGLVASNSVNFSIPNNVQTPFYWNVRAITSIDSSFDSEFSSFVYSQAPITSLSVSDVNFGSVVVTQSKTDSIALVNTGNVDVTVTSYRFTSSGSVTSVVGFGVNWPGAFTIAVGDTKKLAVSFQPPSVGTVSDNLLFISNNQSISSDTIAVFQGIGSASQSEVPPLLVFPLDNSTNIGDPVTLRWNNVPTAVTFEVSLDTLQNLSTAQTVVVADTFNVFNGLLKGKQYYWGVKSQFAQSESAISTIWSFTTQPVAQTNVVIVNTLTLDDFPVDANASKLFTVTVQNLTNASQILQNVSSSNTSEFTVIPQQFAVPIQIPSGGIYSLKVKFKPSAQALYSTILTPVLSTAGNVASGTISGRGRALAGNESVSNIILATNRDTIAQGDTLSVFMKIRERSNFDVSSVPKFRIWLEYDKRMLYFLNQNGGIYFNGTQLSNNSFTTEDVGSTFRQMSSPPISFSNSSDSTLLLLRFVAMMDTIETSSLYFSAVGRDSSGFLWLNQSNNPITSQFTNLENTTINLQLCAVDGKRFIVSKQQQIALMQVSPNPSNDDYVDVEYAVEENTEAVFYIINSAGAIVSDRVKRNELISPSQFLRFKTTNLTTGSYFIVVETKTSMDLIGFQTSK